MKPAILTKKADAFLMSFIEMYLTNKELRESLLVALMHGFLAKIRGDRNPVTSVKAMNFFIACEATSRKTFDLASANFLGPGLRTIQRHNAVNRMESFIVTDPDSLKKRFNAYIKKQACPEGPVVLSLAFDGTKLPPNLSLSHSHQAIVGGAAPNHLISVVGMSEEDVKAKLDPTSSDIIKADEIKVCVVSIQNPAVQKSPLFVLAGQPQTINAVTMFNDLVTKTVEKSALDNPRLDLVSVSADGVGCDNKWVCRQLILFLEGRSRHTGIVDTNHNEKNGRYQRIGGSSVKWLGGHIVDPDMLRRAGVSEDLWRIKDFASDLLVLRLYSVETITRILMLDDDDDAGSVGILCALLFFGNARLYAVNARILGFCARICLV